MQFNASIILRLHIFMAIIITGGACSPALRLRDKRVQGPAQGDEVVGLREFLKPGTGGTEHRSLRLVLVPGMASHPFGDPGDYSPEKDNKKPFWKAVAKNAKDSGRMNRHRLSGEPLPYADLQEFLRKNSLSKEDFDKLASEAILEEQFPKLVDALSGRLKEKWDEVKGDRRFRLLRHPGDSSRTVGYVLRTKWRGVKPERIVEIFHVSYAIELSEKKESQFQLDWLPAYEKLKPLVNRKLKRNMVSWGLADAAHYVGGLREEMEWAVGEGLLEPLRTWIRTRPASPSFLPVWGAR